MKRFWTQDSCRGRKLIKIGQTTYGRRIFFHKTFFIQWKSVINGSLMNITCNFRWKMKKIGTTGHFYKKLKKKIFWGFFSPETQNRYIGPQKYCQIRVQRPQISRNWSPYCHSSVILSKVRSITCPQRGLVQFFFIGFGFLDPKSV